MRTQRHRVVLLLAGCALLAGGLLYMLFRPGTLTMFRWIDTLGLAGLLDRIREVSMPLLERLPSWLVYSLPSGLWAFAYAAIIFSVWYGQRSRWRFVWYASIPLLVVGFELLQLTEVVAGTFCPADMAFGCVGMVAGYAVIKNLGE